MRGQALLLARKCEVATGGRVSRLTVLGWSADAPGCVLLDEDEVRVSQRRPREYDGFDVTVTAAPEARLLLEFAPNDQPSERRYLEIPLRELIPVDGLHDSPLDNQNNRLVIRRTQGDRLRLKVGRQPLVFSTGEYLELGVTAYQPGFRLDAESYLQLKLRRARQGDEIWDRQPRGSCKRYQCSPGSIGNWSGQPFGFQYNFHSVDG